MARRHRRGRAAAWPRARRGLRRRRRAASSARPACRTAATGGSAWRDRRRTATSVSPASRRPSELNSTSGSVAVGARGCAARARRRPSRACACRGSRGRSARRRSSQRSASRGDSVSRATMPHFAGLQRRGRAGWSRCRRRSARACPASSRLRADEVAAPARRQLGERRLDREEEGRAAARARRSRPTCVPPISSASRLLIARPRPVPPYLRVVRRVGLR